MLPIGGVRGFPFEQGIVHFPVFSLLPSTIRRGGCLKRGLMNGLKGKISHNIFHLPGINVLSFDSGQDLLGMAPAELAVVVGKLNHNQRSLRLPFEGLMIHVEDKVNR